MKPARTRGDRKSGAGKPSDSDGYESGPEAPRPPYVAKKDRDCSTMFTRMLLWSARRGKPPA